MIERLLIKNQLSFEECDLEFTHGLIAFTGPSGAGKSVLMQAVLSLFGHSEANASLVEATVTKKLDLESFGLESDEPNIFKYIKSKSTRYFVNMQSISKKNMADVSNTFVNYLSVRDNEEFENEKLLSLLDAVVNKKSSYHARDTVKFKELYLQYKEEKNRLEEIEKKEKKIEELKEFASFEIAKIEEVSPKVGEDEELMAFKRSLSKKEKIEESLLKAEGIFEFESSVSELFSLIQEQGGFFDECMNELRAIVETQRDRLNELDEIDVDSLLERIEKISSLKSRYGTIDEILTYKQKKEEELREYETISFQKDSLINSCHEKLEVLKKLSNEISKKRKESLPVLNEKINSYLSMLYMPQVSILLEHCGMSELGSDALHVALGRVNIKKISSGEYNRLRLAFIATTSEFLQEGGGVLILDEIDANLSGKESMSVAKVLKQLSAKYQIFAISHQPQLSSQADQHFLVTKHEDQSYVRLLNSEERVVELARMVSGEEVSSEATNFAKTLMES